MLILMLVLVLIPKPILMLIKKFARHGHVDALNMVLMTVMVMRIVMVTVIMMIVMITEVSEYCFLDRIRIRILFGIRILTEYKYE